MTARTLCVTIILFSAGCSASGPKTLLELSGDPNGTAQYFFRDVFWCSDGSTGGAPQIVGYGFVPYQNSYMTFNWQPGYGASGFSTMYLRGHPDGNGKYDVMILGPMSPGHGEVLTSTAQGVTVDRIDPQTCLIKFNNAPTTARNKPSMSFQLSGTIVAKSTSANMFEDQLNDFEKQLSWRMSAPSR